jgi:hypothetical protein
MATSLVCATHIATRQACQYDSAAFQHRQAGGAGLIICIAKAAAPGILLSTAMAHSEETNDETIPKSRSSLVLWLRRHQDKLWWLHSLYALALGIGFMWLGRRNFAFLRVAVFHIGFIWLSSIGLAQILNRSLLSPQWTARLRLAVNFFNKNLYQQMLFFVLPIYYGSATLGSRNLAFVCLVALSALLSTLDVIYDRHLSSRRQLTAVFFAFNLFVLVNAMLPILWSVSNTLATRISAILALVGYLTLAYPNFRFRAVRLGASLAIGLVIFALVEFGRPFIPPAPLRLTGVEFGDAFDRESLRMVAPLAELKAEGARRVYGLSAVKAPLGLREKLQHLWFRDGALVCASPFYEIVGGREDGFRLWTSCEFPIIQPASTLRLEVETEGRQLIGRAVLKPPR